MEPVKKPTWWPDRLLSRNPIKRVYICGQDLEPPLLSHVVNVPRLELPLTGRYENQIEVNRLERTVELTPGTALFAPPNCWNLPVWRAGLRFMSVLFGKKQIGISIVTAGRRAGPYLKAHKHSIPRPLTGPLPKILDAMVELCATGAPSAVCTELARVLLYCVQDALSQPEAQPSNRGMSLLESVCVYLQSHYQYDITRDSVAQQFGISPNYLSRIFEVHGHMTFSGYLMHVRTDRAKHLLRAYDLKLDQVAVRCGYRDTAYFCRVFKKIAKLTPTDYRTRHKTSDAAAPVPTEQRL